MAPHAEMPRQYFHQNIPPAHIQKLSSSEMEDFIAPRGEGFSWGGETPPYYDSSSAEYTQLNLSESRGVSARSADEGIPPFYPPERTFGQVLFPFGLSIPRTQSAYAKQEMLVRLEEEGIPTEHLMTQNWTTTAFLGEHVTYEALEALTPHLPMVWSHSADKTHTFHIGEKEATYRTWSLSSLTGGREAWLEDVVRPKLRALFYTDDLDQVEGEVLYANEPFFQQNLVPGYQRTYTLAATYLDAQLSLPHADLALPPLMQDNLTGEVIRDLYRRHHDGENPRYEDGTYITDLEEITIAVATWYVGEILDAIEDLATEEEIYVLVQDMTDENGEIVDTAVYDMNIVDEFDPRVTDDPAFRVEKITNPYHVEGPEKRAEVIKPSGITLHMYDLYNRWGHDFITHLVKALDVSYVDRFGVAPNSHILHESGVIGSFSEEDEARWEDIYYGQFKAILDLWVMNGCGDVIIPTYAFPFAPSYKAFVEGEDGTPVYDAETDTYPTRTVDPHVEQNFPEFAIFEPDEKTGQYVLTPNGHRVIRGQKRALYDTILAHPNSGEFHGSIDDLDFVEKGLAFLSENNQKLEECTVFLPMASNEQ